MKIAAPILVLIACVPCFAQSFEVASVRSSTYARGNDVHVETTPGNLTIRGASLRFFVQWAYDMPPFQFEGPAWMDSTGFDVVAKAATPASDDQMRVMLRALLAERFGLKVHTEHKEMQVYELSVAKGGPKFHESATDGPAEFTNAGKGTLVANHVTMAELASKMSEPLMRPVIDITGLKARYDIRIDVTAYLMDEAKNNGSSLDVMGVLFNAVQAQLGVKLDSRKEAVDILTVDHAEKTPTEN